MVDEIPLSSFGLETVPQVSARKGKGWSPKTVQNWVNAGLLPAVVLGTGRGSMFLVRTVDADKFVPPPRGPTPKAAGKK